MTNRQPGRKLSSWSSSSKNQSFTEGIGTSWHPFQEEIKQSLFPRDFQTQNHTKSGRKSPKKHRLESQTIVLIFISRNQFRKGTDPRESLWIRDQRLRHQTSGSPSFKIHKKENHRWGDEKREIKPKERKKSKGKRTLDHHFDWRVVLFIAEYRRDQRLVSSPKAITIKWDDDTCSVVIGQLNEVVIESGALKGEGASWFFKFQISRPSNGWVSVWSGSDKESDQGLWSEIEILSKF